MNFFITQFPKIKYLVGVNSSKIPMIIFLFFFSTLLDLLGLSLIGPYISFLLDMGEANFLSFSVGSSLDKNQKILILSSILLVIFCLKTIFVIYIQRKIILFSHSCRIDIQARLMTFYQKMDYEDYLELNSSEFINRIYRMTEDFAIRVLTPILKALSDAIIIFFILAYLLFSNPIVVVFLGVIFGLIFFIYDLFFGKKLKNAGFKANDYSKKSYQTVLEAITGFKEIRVLNKENFFHQQTEKYVKKFAKHYSLQQVLSMSPRFLMELMMIFCLVMLVILSVLTSENIQTTFSSLAVFALAGIRLIPSFNGLVNSIVHLRYHGDTINKLNNDFLKFESIVVPKNSSSDQLDNLGKFEKINLSDVSFKYKDSNDFVLKDINIEIKKGEVIGIVGPSGAGKSTLLDLMLGLLVPNSGQITINEMSMISNQENWLKKCAYIPQEVFIIDSSIKENIGLREDFSSDDLKKIDILLEKLDMKKFIKSLEKGLDSDFGDKGGKLSGGQRQRISLARSMFADKEIIFLDEATSSLDTPTEEKIMDALLNLKDDKTLVMIAHRVSTLEHCDRIYEVKNSKLHQINKDQLS